MVVMLLLGFWLRVFRLQWHNLWGDEAFSLAFSKQPLVQVLSAGAETHPPLYHAMLHFWVSLAGQSLFALRFFSVLPGVLLVALLFLLGRRMLGYPGGFLASGLCAISSFAVYYSQETRMYSWAAFFCALSMYADVRWQRTRERRWEALFLGAMLAAIFTHYYSFFLLVAQNLFRFVQRRENRRSWLNWLRGQLFIALAYFPWVLAQIEFIGSKASARWDALGVGGLVAVWAGTLSAFGAGQTVAPLGRWLGIVLLIPLAIGLRGVLQSSRDERVLAYWLFIPMVGAWLLGPLMPFFFPRYLIVVMLVYLLLLAAGLRSSARSLTIFWLLLSLLANWRSLHNYFFEPLYAKGGYGDLMAYVDANRRLGDGLLLQNGAQAPLHDFYGLHEVRSYNMPPWDDSKMQPLLQSVTAQHDRIWLLMYGDPASYDPEHELETWLYQRAFHAYHGDYVDGSLDLFVQGEIMPSRVPEVRFGDMIVVTGFGMSEVGQAPGGTLVLALAWQALRPIDADYTTFVHFLDDEDNLRAQVDSQPLGGTYPTSRWQSGETVIDRVALSLPVDLLPGEYRVQVGWYDLASMQRLPAVGPSSFADRVQVGTVTIAFP